MKHFWTYAGLTGTTLKSQNQHFLTKSKVNLGFEHAFSRAIDRPLKILQDILSLTYSLFLAAS